MLTLFRTLGSLPRRRVWPSPGPLDKTCRAIIVVLTGVMVDEPRNLVSLFGLVVFLAFSWATSYKPRNVQWGPVLSGSKCPYYSTSRSSIAIIIPTRVQSMYLVFLISHIFLFSKSNLGTWVGNSR